MEALAKDARIFQHESRTQVEIQQASAKRAEQAKAEAEKLAKVKLAEEVKKAEVAKAEKDLASQMKLLTDAVNEVNAQSQSDPWIDLFAANRDPSPE